MMAGMLTQLPLPLLPAGAAEIAPGVGLVTGEDGGGLVSVHGLATFAWDGGDEAGRRLAAVQLVRLRAVSQARAAAAFGWSPRTLVDRFPLCRIYIRNVSGSLKTHRAHFPQAALFPDAVVIALDVVEYRGPCLFGIQPQVLVDELFLDRGVK